MKPRRESESLPVRIESLIVNVRGEKVILDVELARIYGVSTKALNQAIKRNIDRFPPDFLIQLTQKEWTSLRSQIVTSNAGVEGGDIFHSRSQNMVRSWRQPYSTAHGQFR